MAKQPPPTGGMSKVRFIMLDAELPSGDVEQITQAIQNALRPVQAVQPRRVTAISTNQRVADPLGEELEEEGAFSPEILDEDVEVNSGAIKRVAPSRPRKYRSPKVLSDVDLSTAPSWTEFVASHNPSSILDKYLMVAAWFKEHRGINAITADHVYTCFRTANWSVGIEDFGQPLRRLRADQLMGGDAKGGFVINHIGLNDVNKMKGG
jgi:hypothetical protein